MFPIAWTIIKMLDFQSQYFEIRNITPVFFLIQKLVLKLKNWKRSKFPLILVTLKYTYLLNRVLYIKNLYCCFLDELTSFLLALRCNLYKEAFSYVKTKINSSFDVKFVGRSNRSFSVYLINPSYLNICPLRWTIKPCTLAWFIKPYNNSSMEQQL